MSRAISPEPASIRCKSIIGGFRWTFKQYILGPQECQGICAYRQQFREFGAGLPVEGRETGMLGSLGAERAGVAIFRRGISCGRER